MGIRGARRIMNAGIYRYALSIIPVFLTLSSFAYGGLDDAKAALERRDYAMAYKEFKVLAEQGDAEAQFNLGRMYTLGQGVQQEPAEALKWYRKAAEQGNGNAQWVMGISYDGGLDVAKDQVEAVKWYRKAAEQGISKAQYNLAHMYAKGLGVQQDYIQAYMWFSLAAARGDPRAEESRDEVATHITPPQIAEAQRLAEEWKSKGKE
jgi:uncharacterized protein